MVKNIVLIVFSVLVAAFAQLVLKQGMTRVGRISSVSSAPSMLLNAITTPLVILGLALFGISAISWLIVLSRAPLSTAYPMVSLGYVFTIFISWARFHEPVKAVTIVGCLAIILGVFLVARGMQ